MTEQPISPPEAPKPVASIKEQIKSAQPPTVEQLERDARQHADQTAKALTGGLSPQGQSAEDWEKDMKEGCSKENSQYPSR